MVTPANGLAWPSTAGGRTTAPPSSAAAFRNVRLFMTPSRAQIVHHPPAT